MPSRCFFTQDVNDNPAIYLLRRCDIPAVRYIRFADAICLLRKREKTGTVFTAPVFLSATAVVVTAATAAVVVTAEKTAFTAAAHG